MHRLKKTFSAAESTLGLFWVFQILGDPSMDAAPPPVTEEPPAQDWSLLPLDLLSAVFVRLGLVEVLRGAGMVCRSWLDAAKVPDLWRVVDMENHIISFEDLDVWRARAKAAVDRSDGQLRVFAGRRFVNAELMQYIVERCVFFHHLDIYEILPSSNNPSNNCMLVHVLSQTFLTLINSLEAVFMTPN
jgi:hypothetical protein